MQPQGVEFAQDERADSEEVRPQDAEVALDERAVSEDDEVQAHDTMVERTATPGASDDEGDAGAATLVPTSGGAAVTFLPVLNINIVAPS